MVGLGRKVLSCSLGFAVVSGLNAQTPLADATQVNQIPPPPTKLEAFQPNPGSVMTVGRDQLGSVKGISVDVRELREPSQPPVRGVVVEVTDSSGHRERSYIDADELAGLLKGIDALLDVSTNPTQFQSFEVRYVTRGSLELTAFNRNSEVQYAVQAGRLGFAKSPRITGADLRQLREYFSAAADKLASLPE